MATGAVYQKVGARDIRPCPVGSSVAIRTGQMLWQDTDGSVKPAASFTWTTDLATTQVAFAAKFIGIAITEHQAGDTDVKSVDVDVSPAALYQVGCTVSTFNCGDMLAPAQDGSNSTLSNVLVMKTATVARAIGRCHITRAVANASVLGYFASAYSIDSGNKNAGVGA